MSSESAARRSRAELEHRGHRIYVWRTLRFEGRRRRSEWHYEALGRRSTVGLKSKVDATWHARRAIDEELDGPFDLEAHIQHLFGGGSRRGRRSGVRTTSVPDRQSRLREWLESVTVENGFTPAEEATAKQKLAEIGDAT
jgi:hypothetical protein